MSYLKFAINEKKFIVVLLSLALLLRLLFLINQPLHFIEGWDASDAGIYKQIAKNFLVSGEYGRQLGQVDAMDPPVYSLFLALIYGIFGFGKLGLISLRVIQSILSSLSCLLIYFTVKEGIKELKTARTAAVISAVYPGLIAYSSAQLIETLYIFILTLFMFCLVKALKCKSSIRMFWLGAIIGISLLTREILALYAIFFAAGLFLIGTPIKLAVKYTIYFGLGILLILTPWILRNFYQFKQFIPLTSRASTVAYVSNIIPEDKLYDDFDTANKKYGEIMQKGASAPEDSFYFWKYLEEMKSLIFKRPLVYVNMIFKKARTFWFWPNGLRKIPAKIAEIRDAELNKHGFQKLFYIARPLWDELGFKLIFTTVYVGIYLFFVISAHLYAFLLIIKPKKKTTLTMLAILLLYFDFLHCVVLFPSARYHLPAIPAIIILSVAFLSEIYRRAYRAR